MKVLFIVQGEGRGHLTHRHGKGADQTRVSRNGGTGGKEFVETVAGVLYPQHTGSHQTVLQSELSADTLEQTCQHSLQSAVYLAEAAGICRKHAFYPTAYQGKSGGYRHQLL